jgi:peptidoglycan/LPS O-acetylase OafA/YrhL
MTLTVETQAVASPPKVSREKHLPQLDGLRALAVCAVIIQHSLGRIGGRFLPFGGIGVRVFFALSGFLITGILLRERGVQASLHPAGHFYARRFLRILPLYFLVLGIAVAFDAGGIRDRWHWHVACLTNVYYAVHGQMVGPEASFWSLSVEEQFYLCWPWFMLLLPWRKLPYFIGAVILAGPIYRLIGVLAGWNVVAVTTFTFSSLDSLGLGALLALASDKMWTNPALRTKLVNAGFVLASILVPLVWVLSMTNRFPRASEVLFDAAGGTLGLWLVGRASIGFAGWFGQLLQHPIMRWIGVRSYGLYVIHGFMPGVASWILLKFMLRSSHAMEHLLAIPMTFLLAAISWTFYERPISRLKRLFPYYDRAPAAG